VGEVAQRVPAHVVGRERLSGAQRTQLEVRLWRDERQPHPRPGKVVQSECELDGGTPRPAMTMWTGRVAAPMVNLLGTGSWSCDGDTAVI